MIRLMKSDAWMEMVTRVSSLSWLSQRLLNSRATVLTFRKTLTFQVFRNFSHAEKAVDFGCRRIFG